METLKKLVLYKVPLRDGVDLITLAVASRRRGNTGVPITCMSYCFFVVAARNGSFSWYEVQ